MPTYPDLVRCTASTCKAQVAPGDLADHLAWHANMNQNNAAIKVLLPLLSINLI